MYMVIYLDAQVYLADDGPFIASGSVDATTYAQARGLEGVEQLSSEVYYSKGTIDVLRGLTLDDDLEGVEGGTLAGHGLYKVSTGECNMGGNPVRPRYVNAESSGQALDAIDTGRKETYEWEEPALVTMVYPGARYTSKALKQIVTDLKKGLE